MYVLGICCFGQHDSGLCLLKDGRIVFAAEEERYSRVKHDNRFPQGALDDCLAAEGIQVNDIEHVGFYCDMSRSYLRAGLHMARFFPGSLGFLKYARDWRSHTSIGSYLRKRHGYRNEVHLVNHHLAHAASTFLVSPFEEAAVVTLDGTGEWTSVGLGRGRGTRVEICERVLFPDSLGKVYEAVTEYLGFKPGSGEGTVMGLAAYGKPTFYPQFERILEIRGGGRFCVDMRYFNYHLGREPRFSDRFVREFGPARAHGGPIAGVHEDLAASLQRRLEDVVLDVLAYWHEKTGLDRLCLAGGVALNCQLNGRIERESAFREIFITPAAGDPGTALGAAKIVHHRVRGATERERLEHPFLGPGYSREECLSALRESGVAFEECGDPARRAAERLADGKVLGWFQGRMEFGPRALGNRSILADPRRAEMKEILNLKVKHREPFRPFASSVLEEKVSTCFEMDHPSPFMLLASRVKESARDSIPATVHVDGTSRLHTVDRAVNPLFHRLIDEFERLTSVPVVLNTSFNARGEPIVRTPREAIACFLGTEMDDLFLGDFWVRS